MEREIEKGEREGKRKSNFITCFENLLLVMFEKQCEIESFGRLGRQGDGLVGTKCKGGMKVGRGGGIGVEREGYDGVKKAVIREEGMRSC